MKLPKNALTLEVWWYDYEANENHPLGGAQLYFQNGGRLWLRFRGTGEIDGKLREFGLNISHAAVLELQARSEQAKAKAKLSALSAGRARRGGLQEMIP